MRRVYYITKRKEPVVRGRLSFHSYCRRRGLRVDKKDPDLVLDYLTWIAQVQGLKADAW